MSEAINKTKSTPKEFRRKISPKLELVGFGVIEYLEFVLLLELERQEGKLKFREGFSWFSLQSILVVMAGPLHEFGLKAHLRDAWKDGPTMGEVFVSTLREHMDLTMKLMNVLCRELTKRTNVEYLIFESDHSKTSDAKIADKFVNSKGYPESEVPSEAQIQTSRVRFSKKQKEWVRLRKKYENKLNATPLEEG
jgi:hypothetical protein